MLRIVEVPAVLALMFVLGAPAVLQAHADVYTNQASTDYCGVHFWIGIVDKYGGSDPWDTTVDAYANPGSLAWNCGWAWWTAGDITVWDDIGERRTFYMSSCCSWHLDYQGLFHPHMWHHAKMENMQYEGYCFWPCFFFPPAVQVDVDVP